MCFGFFLCKSYRLFYKAFRSFGGTPLDRLLRNSPGEFIDVPEVFKSPSLILLIFLKYP